MSIELIWLVVGVGFLVLFGAFGYYWSKSQAHIQLLRDALQQASIERASLEKELALTQTHHAEKITLIEATKKRLEEDFAAITTKLYEERSRAFVVDNEKSLQQLLTPFKEQITKFEQQVSQAYTIEGKERAVLKNELENLQKLNQQLRSDAINLTQALRGDSKAQGNWGEVILERVLEESGLRKGHEYEVQTSLQNSEGKRYQPDVIVHLPNRRDIVIDSKVSLVAYERAIASEDATQKALATKEHLASIKVHIDGLSAKRYETLLGVESLDFVLMFMPIEGAFMLALEADGTIFTKAFAQNIMIVSPSTLLVTLRTIEHMWSNAYQNRNALEIAEKAGNLYDKFVAFVEELEKLGTNIERTQNSYTEAMKKLKTGSGDIMGRIEGLRKLGVKGKKELLKTQTGQSLKLEWDDQTDVQ